MSIKKILQGIDRDEAADTDGWWETSSGADFGHEKLVEAQGYETGLLGRITQLEAEVEALRKDAERLDFMLENSAFMVAHHGNRWQCQTQDLDENYIVLSGIGCSYLTEREAIDAAIKGEQA